MKNRGKWIVIMSFDIGLNDLFAASLEFRVYHGKVRHLYCGFGIG